jgi:hypothetical protein
LNALISRCPLADNKRRTIDDRKNQLASFRPSPIWWS